MLLKSILCIIFFCSFFVSCIIYIRIRLYKTFHVFSKKGFRERCALKKKKKNEKEDKIPLIIGKTRNPVGNAQAGWSEIDAHSLLHHSHEHEWGSRQVPNHIRRSDKSHQVLTHSDITVLSIIFFF